MAGPTNARQHLREEPDALAAHVRICAGGPQQCGFLPRYPYSCIQLQSTATTLTSAPNLSFTGETETAPCQAIEIRVNGYRKLQGFGRAGRPRSRGASLQTEEPPPPGIDATRVGPYTTTMATRTIKSTCSLDLESVRLLVALARHWKVSKSEALRRALRIAARVAGPGKTPTGSLDRLQASVRERKVNLTRWEREVTHERHAAAWSQLPSP